jgi:hypothetical protein
VSPPDLVPDTASLIDSDDEEEEAPLSMSPIEIRVIRRISARCNVLPVIAHADSLTDEKLRAVKNAVRTGLAEAGLDFGIFGPRQDPNPHASPVKGKTTFVNGNGNGVHPGDDSDEEEEEEERPARPVIKLRPKRHGRHVSRSRSRRDLQAAANDPHSPDPTEESVANIRFSANVVAKADLTALMPFALIAPEPNRRRQRQLSGSDSAFPTTPVPPSEDGNEPSIHTQPSIRSSKIAYPPPGPPDDLKGVFIRKFRWGTVDVLDPSHCDYAALRTAVLSTHLKLLKTHTKEVLYEKYRTEKLLARRATRQITDDEKQRLLEDLGL